MTNELALFGDVPLDLTAQVSCRKLTLEQLLELRPGSVIRAARAAGDSVDVRVGDQLVCQGEIIVVENILAIRLSDFDESN